MISAFRLTFEIARFRALGRSGGGGGCAAGGAGRGAEGGQFAADGGVGTSQEGAKGREAADDDAGGDFGGAVGVRCELEIEIQMVDGEGGLTSTSRW